MFMLKETSQHKHMGSGIWMVFFSVGKRDMGHRDWKSEGKQIEMGLHFVHKSAWVGIVYTLD